MPKIFDLDEEPLTEEDIAALIQNAKDRLRLWVKRSIYSGIVFALNCTSVVPFLYGNPLHAYWGAFGKYLVLLSMALLLPLVCCSSLAVVAWILLRDAQKLAHP